VELAGGTHVSWSPPVDYFREIFCRHLRRIGVEVELTTLRHGFYPKGGGRVDARIKGNSKWAGLDLARCGEVGEVAVRSVATEDLRRGRVAERQADGFKSILNQASPVEVSYVASFSTGSAVFGSAACGSTVLGADALGKRGIRAEQVGQDAAGQLKAEINAGASLDVHAADMMLPYLALASGASALTVSELTGHVTSVQWLIRQFIDVDFSTERSGSAYLISVKPKR